MDIPESSEKGRVVVRMSRADLQNHLGLGDAVYLSILAVQMNLLKDQVEIVFEGYGLPECVSGCEPVSMSFDALNAI